MKGLNNFNRFDWDAFSSGKEFMVTSVSDYTEYGTEKHLGTKVEVIIITDNTKYKFTEGKEFTNRFEKLVFKCSKDIKVPLNSKVVPTEVTATIYGDYRNQLSVKCSDIKIIPVNTPNSR